MQCLFFHYFVYKRPRTPKGQSKMSNPKKLETYGTQEENKTKQKHNTICIGHHYAQANTHNVNKTYLQTTGGKDEPNIGFMRKSYQTSQHGTQNIKTHNKTTQTTKGMVNTCLSIHVCRHIL
jgi:hypothetical protein